MAYAGLGCVCLLVVVFATAAASKLRSRQAFAEFVVATGRLAPAKWSGWRRPVAVAVLATESGMVPLLAVPATAPVGFTAATALSVGYAAAIAAALRRGERAPCRCFGGSLTPLGRPHLVRNAVLAGAALVGLLSTVAPPAPIRLAGAVLAVAGGLVVAVLLVRMDDLVALFAPTPLRRQEWRS